MSDRVQGVAADLAESIAITVRDLGRIAGQLEMARERLAAPSSLELFGAAALVSGYYSHLERAFERIVRDMNSAPLDGPDWHRRLLRSMTVGRPGVRPAVIDIELAERLDEILAFRHLFRNLYVLDLRAERVTDLVNLVAQLHGPAVARLAEFQRFLEQLSSIQP